MRTDLDFGHLGDILQNFNPDTRVLFNRFVFFVRELGILVQDIVRNTNFPDIVQQGNEIDFVLEFHGLARAASNFLAVLSHAARMTVRVAVLGINRRSKRLDHLQRKNLKFATAFFEFFGTAFHFAFKVDLQFAKRENSLDSLKQYLTVTATYDDSSTGVVTNYTLSGTLTEGTSVINVSYGGKTITFDVTVAGLDEDVIYQIRNTSYSGEHSSTVTDVFPLTTDSNYLIIADYTFEGTQGSNSYVISILNTGHGVNLEGVRIEAQNNVVRLWLSEEQHSTDVQAANGIRVKVAIYHYAGTNYVSAAYLGSTSSRINGISDIAIPALTTSNPIYAAGADFYGTIHELTVYNSMSSIDQRIKRLFDRQIVAWEQGIIKGDSGDLYKSTTRARTVLYLDNDVSSISIASGFEALLYAWTADGSYVGAWTGSAWETSASYMSSIDFATIKSAYPSYLYKMMLRKTDASATITVDEAYNNVTFA